MTEEKKLTEKEQNDLHYAIVEAFSRHDKKDFDQIETEIVVMVISAKREILKELWRTEQPKKNQSTLPMMGIGDNK